MLHLTAATSQQPERRAEALSRAPKAPAKPAGAQPLPCEGPGQGWARRYTGGPANPGGPTWAGPCQLQLVVLRPCWGARTSL